MPMTFSGRFWSREYESDVDLSEELDSGPLDSPIRCAVADACMDIEPVNAGYAPGSLASVRITSTEDGNFQIVASLEDKKRVIVMTRCDKCSAQTYGDVHPMNGCDAVLIEEIMTS